MAEKQKVHHNRRRLQSGTGAALAILAVGLLGGACTPDKGDSTAHETSTSVAAASPAPSAAGNPNQGLGENRPKTHQELLAAARAIREQAKNGGTDQYVDMGKIYKATPKSGDMTRVVILSNPIYTARNTEATTGSAEDIVMVGWYKAGNYEVEVLVDPQDFNLELVEGSQQDEHAVTPYHIVAQGDELVAAIGDTLVPVGIARTE